MAEVIGDKALNAVPKSLMSTDGTLYSGHIIKYKLGESLTNNYTEHVIDADIVNAFSVNRRTQS